MANLLHLMQNNDIFQQFQKQDIIDMSKWTVAEFEKLKRMLLKI